MPDYKLAREGSGVVSVLVDRLKSILLKHFLGMFVFLVLNMLVDGFATCMVHKPVKRFQNKHPHAEHKRVEPV